MDVWDAVAGCNVGWDKGRLEGWMMGETWVAGCTAGKESHTNIL